MVPKPLNFVEVKDRIVQRQGGVHPEMQNAQDQNVPYILVIGHILGHQEISSKCHPEKSSKT